MARVANWPLFILLVFPGFLTGAPWFSTKSRNILQLNAPFTCTCVVLWHFPNSSYHYMRFSKDLRPRKGEKITALHSMAPSQPQASTLSPSSSVNVFKHSPQQTRGVCPECLTVITIVWLSALETHIWAHPKFELLIFSSNLCSFLCTEENPSYSSLNHCSQPVTNSWYYYLCFW